LRRRIAAEKYAVLLGRGVRIGVQLNPKQLPWLLWRRHGRMVATPAPRRSCPLMIIETVEQYRE
jgi:hypothetical protein